MNRAVCFLHLTKPSFRHTQEGDKAAEPDDGAEEERKNENHLEGDQKQRQVQTKTNKLKQHTNDQLTKMRL